MESSLESSKGHSQCSVSMMLDSSAKFCKYGITCARYQIATWIFDPGIRLVLQVGIGRQVVGMQASAEWLRFSLE